MKNNGMRVEKKILRRADVEYDGMVKIMVVLRRMDFLKRLKFCIRIMLKK